MKNKNKKNTNTRYLPKRNGLESSGYSKNLERKIIIGENL